MIGSAREVCDPVWVRAKNSKNAWWRDVVNGAVERKEVAWKED